MEEVKPKVVRKCGGCYMEVDDESEPHFLCKEKRANGECGAFYCQPCFVSVLKGRSRDNKGWVRPDCSRCKNPLDYGMVRTLLGEEFEAFDAAMVRMVLVATEGTLFCPGVNCKQVFFKPPTRKEKKRNAPGNAGCRTHTCECSATFCTGCGELWNDAHLGKKCVEYAKWKSENDAEALAMKTWLEANPAQKNQIKRCPGCKRMTEKNGGCNDHNCVLCAYNFCWQCLGPYNACRCAALQAKKRALAKKKREKRELKKKANLKVIATKITMEVDAGTVVTVTPPKIFKKSVAPATAAYQDWDVVVLNSKPRVVEASIENNNNNSINVAPVAPVAVVAARVAAPKKEVKGPAKGWQRVGRKGTTRVH